MCLVHGGVKISCEVRLTISESVVKYLLLTQYKKLLNKFYIEPKNEEIVGTFPSVTNGEGKRAEAKSQQQKKATGDEKSKIKGKSGYVTKPKIKKNGANINSRLVHSKLLSLSSKGGKMTKV